MGWNRFSYNRNFSNRTSQQHSWIKYSFTTLQLFQCQFFHFTSPFASRLSRIFQVSVGGESEEDFFDIQVGIFEGRRHCENHGFWFGGFGDEFIGSAVEIESIVKGN